MLVERLACVKYLFEWIGAKDAHIHSENVQNDQQCIVFKSLWVSMGYFFVFLCQRGELWLPILEVHIGSGQLEEITFVYLLVCCVLPPP